MSIYTPTPTIPGDLGKLMSLATPPVDEWEGLTSETLQRFGVQVDPKGVFFPYFRYGGISGYKVRRHDSEHNNRFYAVGDMDGVDLFGQQLCGRTDNLIITEGEKDAMSIFQVLGTDYDVVSIPTGATVKKDGTGVIDKGVKAKEDFLRKYKTVILALDQDEPGQAVALAIINWLGHHCKLVKFPEKDANDMLKHGKTEELKAAIKGAEAYRPVELLSPRDLREELLKPADKGQPYPWESLNALLGGMQIPGVVGWAAGVKVGKTNSAMQLTEHIVEELGEKVGLFYLENTPASTMQIVAGKILGDMSAASRDRDWTEDEVDNAIASLNDKVWIYNTRRGRDWNSIKPAIRWLAVAEGVKYFFIDPITAMVPGDASAANAFLMDLFKEMTALAMELNIHINYYSHLNPPKQGLPHEEGGRVQAIQLTGSRAMIRYSNAIIGIERNVIADDETVKNRSTFRVLLSREIGTKTGDFYCYYNVKTGALLESPIFTVLEGTTHNV